MSLSSAAAVAAWVRRLLSSRARPLAALLLVAVASRPARQLAFRAKGFLLSRGVGLVVASFSSVLIGRVKTHMQLVQWRRRVFFHRLQIVLLAWESAPEGVAHQGAGSERPGPTYDPWDDEPVGAQPQSSSHSSLSHSHSGSHSQYNFQSQSQTQASHRVEKRTLMEGSLQDTIMNGNEAAAALCSRAAGACTSARPFLTQHLDASERYHLLNNALNLVSALTPAGHIAENIFPACAAGCWYVFALAADSAAAAPHRPETPNTKVRVVLVKEATVLWLADDANSDAIEDTEQALAEGSSRHHSRWALLRKMAALYKEQQAFHDNAAKRPASSGERSGQSERKAATEDQGGAKGEATTMNVAAAAPAPAPAKAKAKAKARGGAPPVRVMHVLRVYLSVPILDPALAAARLSLLPAPAPPHKTPRQSSAQRKQLAHASESLTSLTSASKRSPAMFSPMPNVNVAHLG